MTVLMDFAALPPENNSGKKYSGAGSAPLFTAAAWNGLAAELRTAGATYSSVITGLGEGWQGPSSMAMATAAAPYAAWMNATATQAEQTATQATAAAGAYDTALAATVPPPVIAANRAQLVSLVATNVLGQNTPAIMASEAQYMQMWAQDAAAMYGYAGSSAAATNLTPFTAPQPVTNPTALAGQGALGGLGNFGGPVSAGLGRTTALGTLSVPTTWTAVAPAASPLKAALGTTPLVAPPAEAVGIPGMPLANAAGNGGGRAVPQYGFRPTVVARKPAAG